MYQLGKATPRAPRLEHGPGALQEAAEKALQTKAPRVVLCALVMGPTFFQGLIWEFSRIGGGVLFRGVLTYHKSTTV